MCKTNISGSRVYTGAWFVLASLATPEKEVKGLVGSLCSQGPTKTVPLLRAYLCATASNVQPSMGLLTRQCPRSRRSRTHSRGGKRSSSLLGGVQSRYTACKTSSSKDNTYFNSASERPYLVGGAQRRATCEEDLRDRAGSFCQGITRSELD